MNGRRRGVLTALGALVCGFAGVAVAVHRGAPTAAESAAISAPSVPLARATFARYVMRIRAQGRTGAPSGDETKLAFASAGIVAHIDVRVGEAVDAGEPLAELDTSGLAIDAAQARSEAMAAAAAYGDGSVPARAVAAARARLAMARLRLAVAENGTGTAQSEREAASAGLRQSEAKLALDRSALERQLVLYDAGVAAHKDVEAAREALAFDRADAEASRARATSAAASVGTALVQARADLAQAESDLRAAEAQRTVTGAQAASARARYDAARHLVTRATLRAPAAGVVTVILKHAGEAVDPAQGAIVLAPRPAGEVTLSVASEDARSVRAGDAVRMAAGSGAGGAGRVRAVVPGVDPATQTATVVVTGAPAGAMPGDAVEATIDVGERRGIVIPTNAIVEDPQTGADLVFVRERLRDGTVRFVSRKIVVAAGDDRRTLVAGGLRGGERVAAQGAFDLLAPGGGG